MTGRRFASNAAADAVDSEYWRALPDAARVQQVWSLSLAQWTLQGDADNASRFHRSVTRIRRG